MKQFKISAFADEAGSLLSAQVDAMSENGLYGLEIRNVDSQNVVDMSVSKIKEIRNELESKNLCIWSMGSPIGKIGIRDDFAPHLDQFKHLLELTDAAGAKCIRLFSFYMPKDEDPSIFRDEVMERLSRLCEAADGSDIILCHENEKGIYGDNAQRCLEIHKAVPQLKAVFDPANFVQCGQDTWEAWRLLSPYVYYMHIKDALPDGNVVPAGEGAGHLPEILAQYNGEVLTLEPHLKVFDGLEKLEGGEKSVVGIKQYPSQRAAFDAAVVALRQVLEGLK